MEATNDAAAASATHPAWMRWTGWALSALPVLMMGMSAGMKLSQNPKMMEMASAKFGYQTGTFFALGFVELACAVIYLVPQTAVLGAILVTGYLGGAVATHVRVADMFAIPLALGVLAWAGLFLRDARLRALLPLRRRD